jgi:predicted acylesterase/phospholipase RssA
VARRKSFAGRRGYAAALAAALVLLASLALSCVTADRTTADFAGLTAAAESAARAHRQTIDRVVERLAERAALRGDHTLDLLLLSAGGQNGAYGVGFLRGWRERNSGAMPSFDLVSGVSTGALQAPFAFLATTAALDQAAELYRQAERLAPRFDWLFWLRRNGGVLRTGRFERALRATYDHRLMDALAPGFRERRQILVATSDMDLGVGRVWDFDQELETPGGEERLQDVLLAATAIPGIFPPVVIDGHTQMDGGVVSNLLPVLELDDYRALASRLRAKGFVEPVTVRVWVVMNLWTHAKPTIVERSSRSALSARGTSLLFATHQPQMLEWLAERARVVSRDVPGLRMEMHATAIPSELAAEPEADKLFDGPWMRRLEELGYSRAQSDSPWDAVPSAFERPLLAASSGG